VRNTPVAQGRFFDAFEQQQNATVIVLGADLAKRLFDQENPIGKSVQVNNLSFQVIGVMQAKGSFLGPSEDDAAYIPITTMADQVVGKRTPYGISVDYIEVSARDKQSIRAAAFQITNLLTQRHGKKDFTIVANKSFQTLLNQLTEGASMTLAAIASISLVVGGIGIMNIMLVSVTERTQEIGLRKALGATSYDILGQFLVEAVILSVVGGGIGICLGTGCILIVSLLTPIQPAISLGAILLSVGISCSIGLFFGIAPAQKAAKLDPIVALRTA
jgi:putative ABC transport system permease protein